MLVLPAESSFEIESRIATLLRAAGLTHHAPYLHARTSDFVFQKTSRVRRDLRRYFDEADKKKEAAVMDFAGKIGANARGSASRSASWNPKTVD